MSDLLTWSLYILLWLGRHVYQAPNNTLVGISTAAHSYKELLKPNRITIIVAERRRLRNCAPLFP